VIAVLLVVVDHDEQHCYHHVQTVNRRRLLAVYKLLMMGKRISETC